MSDTSSRGERICFSAPLSGIATVWSFAMFIEAAHAVADQVTPEQLNLGMLFPPQSNMLETEIKVAARVAKVVFDSNLARIERPADCDAFIRSHVYKPEYQSFV